MSTGRKPRFGAYQSGSIRNTEMAGAENLELVPKVATFSGNLKDTAFYLLSASRTQEQSYHGDDQGRNLDLVTNGWSYCTKQKSPRKHFRVPCGPEYAAVTPSVGISSCCCLPFWTWIPHVVRFQLLPTFPFQSLIRLLWISLSGHRRLPSWRFVGRCIGNSQSSTAQI